MDDTEVRCLVITSAVTGEAQIRMKYITHTVVGFKRGEAGE
jgi:hypothetical protein